MKNKLKKLPMVLLCFGMTAWGVSMSQTVTFIPDASILLFGACFWFAAGLEAVRRMVSQDKH